MTTATPSTVENDPALPDARVGTVLADRYRINALLGEGGMGKVYAAEHVLMRKKLAVKVLHRELTTVPEVVQRFEREAMAAANIEHANVAAATDFGKLPDGAVFLVLEYVQGRNLRDVIAEGPLPVARALHIARQVASALGSAHTLRIVHRDLKPENVMLVEKSGDQDFVKVLDFGIAKVPIGEVSESGRPPGSPITKAGMVFGTPEYMAPEQALGQVVDGRADLFGLGVILYEMLAGVRPFSSHSSVGILGQQLSKPPPTFAERAPGLPIPGDVERIVRKLLDKEAGDRYQTAEELVAAIDAVSGLPPRSLRRAQRSEGSLADLRMSREALGERQELPGIPEPETVEPPTVFLPNRPPAELPLPSFEGVPTMGVGDAKFQLPPTQLGLPAGDLPPPPAPPERPGLLGTLQKLGARARTALGQQIAASLSWIDASREKWPAPVERALDPISARAILAGACLAVFVVVLTTVIVIGSLLSGPSAAPANDRVAAVPDPASTAPAATTDQPAPPEVAPAPSASAAAPPTDAPGWLRLAEQQLAGNEPVKTVQSLTQVLALDPKASEDSRVVAALKKTVQIKASADKSFGLLQGPMGAAGADVIYDLALGAGDAALRKRAETWLASAQFQKNSSPELNIAVALRQATTCSERQGLLLRARNVGDTRSLDYLKQWESTTGCGPQKKADCNPCLREGTLLKEARAAIEKRARSGKR